MKNIKYTILLLAVFAQAPPKAKEVPMPPVPTSYMFNPVGLAVFSQLRKSHDPFFGKMCEVFGVMHLMVMRTNHIVADDLYALLVRDFSLHTIEFAPSVLDGRLQRDIMIWTNTFGDWRGPTTTSTEVLRCLSAQTDYALTGILAFGATDKERQLVKIANGMIFPMFSGIVCEKKLQAIGMSEGNIAEFMAVKDNPSRVRGVLFRQNVQMLCVSEVEGLKTMLSRKAEAESLVGTWKMCSPVVTKNWHGVGHTIHYDGTDKLATQIMGGDLKGFTSANISPTPWLMVNCLLGVSEVHVIGDKFVAAGTIPLV